MPAVQEALHHVRAHAAQPDHAHLHYVVLPLAAHAAAFLRERYDEDWWRNPRSSASLQGIWARGGRATCAELWAEMGGEPGLDPLLLEFSDQCG